MDFTTIVNRVADRLNLTSSDAITRIEDEVNDRYARITSSIGLQTSRKVTTTKAVTVGSQSVTFDDVEKILVVWKLSGSQKYFPDAITDEEMDAIDPVDSDTPRKYSIRRLDYNSVTIRLDVLPETAFTLYAEAIEPGTFLGTNDVPNFPESFHDILVWGALADEYRRMQQKDLRDDAEMNFERRLSDLRMFIAKDGYVTIAQGKIVPKWLRP